MIVNSGHRRDFLSRACLIGNDGWKLVEIDREKNDFQLYNITNDNEERHDLAGKYPEKVTELKKTLLRELDSARPDLPLPKTPAQ